MPIVERCKHNYRRLQYPEYSTVDEKATDMVETFKRMHRLYTINRENFILEVLTNNTEDSA